MAGPLKQASSYMLIFTVKLDGDTVQSLDDAALEIYDCGDLSIRKTLSNGMTFDEGVLSVPLPGSDTESLSGQYSYELWVRIDGNDYFAKEDTLTFAPTNTRIDP